MPEAIHLSIHLILNCNLVKYRHYSFLLSTLRKLKVSETERPPITQVVSTGALESIPAGWW